MSAEGIIFAGVCKLLALLPLLPTKALKLIMKIGKLPPVELLRAMFDYDQHTGIITWKVNRQRARAGTEAGKIDVSTGYLNLCVCYRKWKQHRIAWALHYGEDPYPLTIDHINRDKTDNRIENLRAVTQRENNLNRPEKVKCGAQRRRRVKITYPDGRGSIIVDSGRTASRLLNCAPSTITEILKREDNQLYWGGRTNMHTQQPSGIRLDYCD